MVALSEFLKGTVTDSLGKVLQPAGLIPGALFVLLNLAFVVPAASDHHVGIVEAYSGLEEGWRAVVVGVLVIVVGYLLLSASGAVLDSFAGLTWKGSLLALALSWWRDWRRDRLVGRLAKAEPYVEDPDDAAWRRRTRFAPDGERSSPTALGDALQASDAAIERRYGVRLAALWQPLRASVKADEPAVAAAVDQKATVDLIGNLAFVGFLFVLEAMVVFTLFDDDRAVLIAALAGLPPAYLAYRIAVTKTLSWCDAIDTTVALHRAKLLEAVGARKTTTHADRLALTRRLSSFMLTDAPTTEIFEDASAAPGATVVAPQSVEALIADESVRTPWATPAREHRASISYRLLVARKAEGPAATVDVLLRDGRLPRVHPEPADTANVSAFTRLPADGPQGYDLLQLRLPGLEQGASRTLRFRLDEWWVAVPPGFALTVAATPHTLLITIQPPAAATSADLSLFHALDGPRELSVAGEGVAEILPLAPPVHRYSVPVQDGQAKPIVVALDEVG